MATTRIIPMHRNKGKSIAQCLCARTDYVKNPEKTNDGELISAFACDPRTVDAEFLLSKKRISVPHGPQSKKRRDCLSGTPVLSSGRGIAGRGKSNWL